MRLFTRTFLACTMCAVAVALLVVGCGDSKAPSTTDGRTAADGKASPTASSKRPANAPLEIDTTDGVITLNGSGLVTGTWKLKDVTAYLDEHAKAGNTTYELSVEAHDLDAGNHFRIRLQREGESIDPGTYSIGGTDRKVEARFEHVGTTYSSRLRGSGSVELTALNDERAAGKFDVSIATQARSEGLLRITGTFDQRLTR